MQKRLKRSVPGIKAKTGRRAAQRDEKQDVRTRQQGAAN
jgi:hypothetical protein